MNQQEQLPTVTVIKLFAIGTGIVVFAMVSVFAFFVYTEAHARNDLIYQQCVSGELRDTVIVQQLEAAKARLQVAIPDVGDPVRRAQELVLEDGIATLEPEGEGECFRPNNWWPW